MVGIVFGLVGAGLARMIDVALPNMILLTLLLAYGSLYVGEHLLHVSGIVAVLVTALVFKFFTASVLAHYREDIHKTWESLGFIANVFVLLGLVVTIDMFTSMYWAILLAIGGAFVARVIAVYSSVYINHFSFGQKLPTSYPPIVIWGGLRGAVTIALVLSLPTNLEYWWTIQSIGFGVVIFSLIVQATANPILVKKLIVWTKYPERN